MQDGDERPDVTSGAWVSAMERQYRRCRRAMSPTTRTRLPWQVVLAATVLAALAAIAAYALLDGDDDTSDSAPSSRATLPLTPVDEVERDPLAVTVSWPDGTETTLADELDGPTVVNFFAEWCVPCIRELPDFEQVSQELSGAVGFLGVAIDRTENAERIIAETGVTYPWLADGKGDVTNAADVTQMPSTMFVDADGDIVSVHSGALDADELRELISSELGVDTR